MENEKLKDNAAPELQTNAASEQQPVSATKFCRNCGGKIAEKAVICPLCGCQVEELKSNSIQQPQIVINNENSNVNQNNVGGVVGARMRNKWTAVLLCLFLGCVGGHKFYEGKIGMGILYLLTMGIGGIGALVDLIVLLLKPNPYYV